MLSLQNETLLTLTEAAKQLPKLRGNKPVSVSTLWRWASRGVRGVRLETALLGGTRLTSVEALNRFSEALSVQARCQPGSQERCLKGIDEIESQLRDRFKM